MDRWFEEVKFLFQKCFHSDFTKFCKFTQFTLRSKKDVMNNTLAKQNLWR